MKDSVWLVLDNASDGVVSAHRSPPTKGDIFTKCHVVEYVPASYVPRWRSVKDDPPGNKFKLVLVRRLSGHYHTMMPAMFTEGDVEWMPIPGGE